MDDRLKMQLDSEHPVMLRHPLTGKMVYVGLDTVVNVAEHYLKCGEGFTGVEDMPRAWKKALVHFRGEILRLHERRSSARARGDELCECLKGMSLVEAE